MFAQVRISDGLIIATTSKQPHPASVPPEIQIVALTPPQAAAVRAAREPRWNGSSVEDVARVLVVDRAEVATVVGAPAELVALELEGFTGDLDLFFSKNGAPLVVRVAFIDGAGELEIPTDAPAVYQLRGNPPTYHVGPVLWTVAAQGL